MSFKHYINYLYYARYRNGHGVHSPFMYHFTVNILSRKRGKDEGKDKVTRLISRFELFCKENNLQLIKINTLADIPSLKENNLAYIPYPYQSKENIRIWNQLQRNKLVSVSCDIYKIGFVFTLPKLQKQHYCMLFK
ncbi:MAG: hypothetical protein LBH34_01970 [Prevotellaceae bacterium]|nr:hypothetical protein [Prevotellaceae bacterium]